MQKKTLVVIGGGAAGFFCAVNAASQSKSLDVFILEKTNKLLTKVRVSGGGRCNVTHSCFSIAEMIKKYPRGQNFLKRSFHKFFTGDTIDWFESKNVKLKTEPDGRMFPVSNSSKTIIECLMQQASDYNVQILINHEVLKIESTVIDKKFKITCKNESVLYADFICIACGGYNKKEQYKWLNDLGHSYENPVPSLFTFNIPANPIIKLMGIAVPDVIIKISGTKLMQQGPVLITYWGLSGPAILKLSSFAAKKLAELSYLFSININWLPLYNENSLLTKLKMFREELASQKIINKNPFNLPNRLWEYHLNLCEIKDETRWADVPSKNQNLLAKQLCSQQLNVQGKTTFKEEFVTAGGIKLNEVDPVTMMSKIISNLFFAGEILDVDGITGGFNFQHAWTSGWIAAKEIISLVKKNLPGNL